LQRRFGKRGNGLGHGESGACPATAARAVSGGDSKETVGARAEEIDQADIPEHLQLLPDFVAGEPLTISSVCGAPAELHSYLKRDTL